jgi:hypothetical protein
VNRSIDPTNLNIFAYSGDTEEKLDGDQEPPAAEEESCHGKDGKTL